MSRQARTPIERARSFDHRFAKAQATEVIDLQWGYALLQSDFPMSEYHNRIAVTAEASPAEIVAATDDILGGAGLKHRYLSADDQLGEKLRPALVDVGYEHEAISTMIHDGSDLGLPSHEVTVVSAETLKPALIRDWRVAMPDADDDQLDQLASRESLYALGAEVTLLAVYDDNEIVAHANAYFDPVDRIAQFESLTTHHDYRGRGFGDALLSDALRRGREAGAELSVLTADVDSFTPSWYGRRGYVEAGRTHHFSRR